MEKTAGYMSKMTLNNGKKSEKRSVPIFDEVMHHSVHSVTES